MFDVLSLAFDRSVRSYDADGRLHVKTAHISKATVNPYWGEEIPDYEKLGLRKDKKYYLLRDPNELKKAAKTFNNLPILSEHQPVTADAHKPELVIGSTGTDARYNHPYLDNSLAFWPRSAIDDIEDGSQKELSCAYRYKADMTPGEYEGQKYDGVMRDIVGNHVALVKEGRAGSDVCVGDSKFKEKSIMKFNHSPGAMIARGALMTYLQPRLASDKMIDLKPILKDVSAKSFKVDKIAKAVKMAADGKLAKDADLEDIEQVLSAVRDAISDEEDDAEHEEEENEDAYDEDEDELEEAVRKFLAERLSEEDQRELDDLMKSHGKRSEDEDRRDEEKREDKREDEEEEEGEDEGSRDVNESEEDDEDDDKRDEKEGEDGRHKRMNHDAEEGPVKVKRDTNLLPVTKKAMDAAIKRAQDEAVANQRAIREAERFVRPYVGELDIAFDSADEVYRHALEMKGVKTKGVHPSAFKVILENLPRNSASELKPMAADSASIKSFNERFPMAARIGRV